jgi:hypothetical protein
MAGAAQPDRLRPRHGLTASLGKNRLEVSRNFHDGLPHPPWALAQGADGALWIGTSSGGLADGRAGQGNFSGLSRDPG